MRGKVRGRAANAVWNASPSALAAALQLCVLSPQRLGEAREPFGELIAMRELNPAPLHVEEIVFRGGIGRGLGAAPTCLGVAIAFADLAGELLEHDAPPAPPRQAKLCARFRRL